MKLTLEDCKDLHMEMWNELAETGSAFKQSTYTLRSLTIPVQYDCFLCEGYFYDQDCPGCPLAVDADVDADDDTRGAICCRPGRPYAEWVNADSVDERKRLALKIACIWED